jgi:atypical dual specificity phosphatase
LTKLGDLYRWIYGRLLRKPTNYSWIIKDKLAASGLVKTSPEFEWVIKQGIKSIVTLREEPLPSSYFDSSEYKCINYLHLNVKDYDAPTLEVLIKTVDYVEEHIKRNLPVLVHCNGGRGRTGTLLTAYFMKKDNLTVTDALIKIKNIRGKSPHRPKQIEIISAYDQCLKKKSKTDGLSE